LVGDFPDAIFALRALENSSKRQLGQHCNERLTHVHWGGNKLVFPTIALDDLPASFRERGYSQSPSCGSIITVTSLDSNIRGQQHARADGTVIRPSLVLLDDPQTRESAHSAEQTRKRLDLLHGDVLGMAGPGQHISALLTCTVMYEDDLADTILDQEKSPQWDSERTKLVYKFPIAEKLWEEYANVRRGDGQDKATAFYTQRREAMDAGSEVAWPARYDESIGEVSALQHAMGLRFRLGLAAFNAEYQNEPEQPQLSDQVLTAEQVYHKLNAYPRGEVPTNAIHLTAFIDVHDRLLFFVVAAWEPDLTGYVVDYGTWPEQTRQLFTLADAPRVLRSQYPGGGNDGAIHGGLADLVKSLLSRDWKRAGNPMRIERLLIDMGYKPGIVADVRRQSGGNVTQLCKGIGIRASRKPIAEYSRKPGEVIGCGWYVPSVRRTGQYPHVLVDVNFWKSAVHAGFFAPLGERGCLSLWGSDWRQHALFADHIARAERWVEVTGPSGRVREWSSLPGSPDNHWLDCLVGCMAAASMLGCAVEGTEPLRQTRRRKVYSREDLTRAPR